MEATETLNIWLVKADLFRIVSLGFSYPDEISLHQRKLLADELLKSNVLNAEVSALVNEIQDNFITDEIITDYSRLYIQKAIPQTESYCTNNLEAVSDTAGFYKAFGVSPKSGDSPDALNYELEFASVLLTKMALAQNDEQVEVVVDAYKKFLDDHLQSFVIKFCEKLDELPASNYTRSIAKLMLYLVNQ